MKNSHSRLKIIGKKVGVACAVIVAIVAVLSFFISNVAQLAVIHQPSLQNKCPLSLHNGDVAYVYFTNAGKAPAIFSVNVSSNVYLINYSNSHLVQPTENASFGFIANWANKTVGSSFYIQTKATCKTNFPTIYCFNPYPILNCNYKVINSSYANRTI